MAFTHTGPHIEEVPIIFSSPHSGRKVPKDVLESFASDDLKKLPDTDFDIDKLYDFAPSMGAHLLTATYNRYFIDLNRSLDSTPLYKDGRSITGLLPLKSFSGESIYIVDPDDKERDRRIKESYKPYHAKLESLISDIRSRHDNVLLFECHSISRNVKSIQNEDFPDLMLGTDDSNSLPKHIEQKILSTLEDSGFTVALNHPFKGGYITRHYHNTKKGIFSVQLEMSKDLYLDEKTNQIDSKKSHKIISALKSVTKILTSELK